ncbi:PREDICTED: uncharacterized protein LOC105448014 [Wasmannia auropunctata]|uniref:uncharacterized protein LOC105448014 n=1 Tax=Wasmannia auropunctata TaxID=64793 RepID=UPI0005EE5815|nr:PREDICTED: uncharacterized protein LOC105448014 [Wasmannia auropunctata]
MSTVSLKIELSKAVHGIKQKLESASTSHGFVAQPAILSNVLIRPPTNNLMRNIHVIQGSNIQNRENKENLENNSMELQHTNCCDKCRIGHFTKFATIERKLNRIIHFLENGNEVRNEIPENDFSLLPNFPLTTVEQVETFNNQLEDINVRRQFQT